MEVRKPIRNQRISADWGRSVAERLRALDVSAEGATRTPTGATLPPRTDPGVAYANPPDEPFAVWLGADTELYAEEPSAPRVRVRLGSVRNAAGEPLSRHDGDFAYDADARRFEAEAPDGTSTVAAEDDGNGGWTLRLLSGGESGAPAWRVPIAEIAVSEKERRVLQLRTGDIALPEHWGATSPMAEIPADGDGSWNAVVEGSRDDASAVAESRLVDIDVDSDGKVTGRHYRTQTIDANGNVVAISERTENPDPEPGAGEDGGATPECGHPLNGESEAATGGDHPLDAGGGNREQGYNNADDGGGHPLDSEGPGGFTPLCADDA